LIAIQSAIIHFTKVREKLSAKLVIFSNASTQFGDQRLVTQPLRKFQFVHDSPQRSKTINNTVFFSI